ncbi:MAG: ComEC/Rec2 family competence protein [Dermatophilaceae bacterium]
MSDLRLVGPAVAAWAGSAALLAVAPPTRLVVAGLCAATAAAVRLGSGSCTRWLRAGRAARRGPSTAVSRDPRTADGVRWVVVLGLVLLALLQVAAAAQHTWSGRTEVAALAVDRASVTATVVLTGDAQVVGTNERARLLRAATLTQMVGRGSSHRADVPVLLVGGEAIREPPWRATVRVVGRLEPADAADGRAASLRVTGTPEVVEPPGMVATAADRLRAGLRQSVDGAPPDPRGLLPGLVVGDTTRTPADLTEAMRASGMTHLTAVSGSNCTIVTAIVLGLASLLGLPRRLRPLVALVALAGFVVLARPEPSVVRAATMGAIGLLGLSRSRRSAGLPVLGGAVVVVLVVDPWLARSYGFALSTLATLGILLFTRPWADAVASRLPVRLSALGTAVALPVAAQAATAPVVVLLQGSVSLVGVAANVLAAPLVAPATVAGVAAALASVLSDRLATVLGWVGVLPAAGIAQVARHSAQVPGGTVPWPDGPLGAILLTAVTVAVLLTGRSLRAVAAARPVLTLVLAGLAVGVTLPTHTVTWPPDGWRVVVCDVGQGDAIVLRSGPSAAVLVDTGPDPPLVDGCLDRLGVESLDAVVLTHLHADHVDGLTGAIDGRQVHQLLLGPERTPARAGDEIDRLARDARIPVVTVRAGDRLVLGELDAVVWSPARTITAGSVPNNASVVLAASTGGVDALLLGDIEREACRDLLLRLRREPGMMRAAAAFDVVKTPHHGSADIDPDLLAAVRSPVAVVSVGADNDYGHPAPRHLQTLRHQGFTTYRTDRHGDVALLAGPDGDVRVTTRG